MAYEFLKKLFGEPKEGEEPKKMSYDELEAAIDADKDIQVIDVKAGNYVSKEKFDAKNTELAGIKQQLTDANTVIASYKEKDTDVESARKRAEEWEEKYNSETKALNDKLEAQAREHATDMYFNGYKFSSTPAKAGVRAEFEKKQFKLEEGKFVGADEFMKGLMESEDYKNAFVIEEKENNGGDDKKEKSNFPFFAQSTGSSPGGESDKKTGFNFGFARLTQPENNRK